MGSAQRQRITSAVPILVMPKRNLPRHLQKRRRAVVKKVRADGRLQLDQGPLVVLERARFLQDSVGDTHLAQVVQGSGVEQQMCTLPIPAHVLRQYGGVMAETYVVIRSLVIFVTDSLIEPLRCIQMGLRQLAGI